MAYRRFQLISAFLRVRTDMVKCGIDFAGTIPLGDAEQLELVRHQIWVQVDQLIKCGWLYAGAIAVITGSLAALAAGNRRADQFKALLVLDRWMFEPGPSDLVTRPKLRPISASPKYYKITADDPARLSALQPCVPLHRRRPAVATEADREQLGHVGLWTGSPRLAQQPRRSRSSSTARSSASRSGCGRSPRCPRRSARSSGGTSPSSPRWIGRTDLAWSPDVGFGADVLGAHTLHLGLRGISVRAMRPIG